MVGNPDMGLATPDALVAIEPEKAETETEKKKREAHEQEDKLKEFGGPASIPKLMSLANPLEIFVFLIGCVASVLHGLGQPLLCLMFGDLIDSLAVPSGVDFFAEVSDMALTFIWISVGVAFVGSIQGACFPWFTDRLMARFRPLYFEAMLHRDIGWFDVHDAGALPAEMGEDLDKWAEAFGNKLGVSIMSTSCVIFGYALAVYLSWQVALVMTVALPVLAVGAMTMGQAMMDMVMETQTAYRHASNVVDEVLCAVRTVVAFGGERRELNRYEGAVEIACKGGLNNRIKTGAGMGYLWFAYFASMALAFWFGMRMVYNDVDLSVGNMMSSFFCVQVAGFTMGQIPPGPTGLINARIYMARFFYIKDHDSHIQRRLKEDRKVCGPIQTLQLEDVHFSYPARPDIQVLKGLNMIINKGQKVAVVGESGSGKSTVMALLERVYDPSAGQVRVNGENLIDFSVKSFRKQIGYVGQEPVLFATTVKNNILQGSATATSQEIQQVAASAQLDFIQELPDKYETFVGSGGSQFSGGQKQRIAIARALIKSPSVLFLDEATSALDSTSEKMIQDTIDKLGSNNATGMTIVTIAHRLSTVRNSDIIYVLWAGVVQEHGSHDQLMAMEGGTYQALAAAQEMAHAGEATAQTGVTSENNVLGNPSSKTWERQVSKENSGSKSKWVSKDAEQEEQERIKKISKEYKVPMRRLLNFCKPELVFFVPGILSAIISGACFPFLGAFVLVDAVVAIIQPDKDLMKKQVEEAAIWFVAAGVVKCVATIGQFGCFGVLGEAITKRCRTSMLTSIFRQEIGFHDDPEHTPGRLVKALQLYAYRISVLCVAIGDKSDALSSVVVGLVMAFFCCWEMTLAMMLFIPIFAVTQGIQFLVTMGASKDENTLVKNAAQVLADAISNVRTVKASGNEMELVSLYRSMLEPTLRGMTKRNLLSGLAFGISNSVMFWICAAGFWFMGFLIRENRTDFEQGQRAFMGVLYAAMGAGMALGLTGDAAKAKVACHDLFLYLDRKSLIDGLEPQSSNTDSKGVGHFEFRDVKFLYPFRPDVQVLKGVSFTIKAQQSVGVCGPSGGGKSTVLSMIQRFYDPQSGSVLIGESKTPLSNLNIRWWRKQVGFVGQEPILFNTTVLENVKYGLEENEFDKEELQEQLDKCKKMANLNFLDSHVSQGWETNVGPRGARLSGGQKQRVAICRALIRNPPVLLLDEATSALDSQSESVVQKALEKARQGRTSFAIAHRLSTIQNCDVIIVISEGQVVENGSHSELMQAEGVYKKLVQQGNAKTGPSSS